jgi:hypothetical protein
MSAQKPTKAVVTVAEMARMVGLSRARFYQLVAAGTFPQPIYDVTTRRPHYVEEQQEVCLEVRRRNCGVDGKPVLFYTRRVGAGAPRASTPRTTSKPRSTKPQEDLLLQSIRKFKGMESVTPGDIQAAVTDIYPSGVAGVDQGIIFGEVFRWLKRRNPADSAG